MSLFRYALLCANHLEEDERAGCLGSIVLWVCCYCKCSMTLSHGAVGWSTVFVCGIS